MSKDIRKIISDYQSNLITKKDFIDSMYIFHEMIFNYVQLIHGSDLKKIEISDGVTFYSNLEDLKFKFFSPDKRAAPFEILNFKKYEVNDSRLIYNLIEEDSVFFDIGANIGWYSLHVAKKVKRGRVFSFEPVPSTFEQLKSNTLLNNLNNISIVNEALSDCEGQLELYVNQNMSVSSSSHNILNDSDAKRIFVPKTTLDSYVNLNLIEKIDFIKCDVEGAEYLVIKGGIGTIKKFRPLLFLEMLRKWSLRFNYHPNDIINTLSDLNYSCFVLNANNELDKIYSIDDETIQTNFLFIPNESNFDQINQRVFNA